MKSKAGPIIIAEDDLDDQEFMKEVLESLELSNKLLFFPDGKSVLDYLRNSSEQPFIIFCDINMPLMNGIQLRKAINEDEYLRVKSIPFIFLSTHASVDTILEAYDDTVQGFFKKTLTLDDLKETLKIIITYWTMCKHPNN